MNNVERFMKRIDMSAGEDACWEWQGAVGSDGYGRVKRDGKTYSAHRYSYALFKGFIPEKLCVLHRCDNTKCVNPTHLFVGTKKDNSVDMFRKGRQGDSTPHLTLHKVEEIRALLEAGKSKQVIAARYSVCRSTIQDIANGLVWKHALNSKQLCLFE